MGVIVWPSSWWVSGSERVGLKGEGGGGDRTCSSGSGGWGCVVAPALELMGSGGMATLRGRVPPGSMGRDSLGSRR